MTTFDFDSAWSGEKDDADPDDRDVQERRESLRSRVFSLAELLHQEIESSEPLLGPLVRRGQRTIIGGWGGHGKTTMAMHMLRAITTGDRFLGWHGPEDGARGLIIDVEQGARLAIRRVVESWAPGRWDEEKHPIEMVGDAREDMHRTHYAVWPEGVRLNDPRSPDAQVIGEIIGEFRPDVVLLDPAYKTFIGNNNEEEVVKQLTAVIDGWRVEHGFALILPMHCRKGQGGSFSMQDLAGSYIWSAWAEVIVGVRRKKLNGLELYFWKDREGDLPPEKWDLTLDKEVGEYIRHVEDVQAISTTERVWRILQENAGTLMTRKQINDLVDVSPRRLGDALRSMEHDLQKGKYPGLEVERTGKRGTRTYRYQRPDLDEWIRRAADAGLDPMGEF